MYVCVCELVAPWRSECKLLLLWEKTCENSVDMSCDVFGETFTGDDTAVLAFSLEMPDSVNTP